MVGGGRINVTGIGAPRIRVDDLLLPEGFVLAWEGKDDVPDLEMEFEVRDGVPECRSVVVTSKPDGRPVNHWDLREIKVESFTTWAAAMIALHVIDDGEDGAREAVYSTNPQDVANALAQMTAAKSQGGSRRKRDVDLADVARIYSAAKKAPTKAVADHFGMPHRTAGLYIRRARDAGILGATPGRGKGGVDDA